MTPLIVAPAGTPEALHTAIEAGADAVYIGFRNASNARNFPGLNFTADEAAAAIEFAHARAKKVYIAINAYTQADKQSAAHEAIATANDIHADAIILADIGLLDFARKNFPHLKRHLSVQASASSLSAIQFYHQHFQIQRVVLPRVLTLSRVAEIAHHSPVEIEIFAFGGLCIMAEGRCTLSGYVTGKSPNRNGVCSPAASVRYEYHEHSLDIYLGQHRLNHFAPNEPACYPTACKGCYQTGQANAHAFAPPCSLDISSMMHEVMAANIAAIKIEGRQRGNAYVHDVVAAFRTLIDAGTTTDLTHLAEGQSVSPGPYAQGWF